jgi:hypothetical protein
MWTDVSEEHITSILAVENQPSSETSVHIRTTRRDIPEDGNIHNYSCKNLKSYIWKYVVSTASRMLDIKLLPLLHDAANNEQHTVSLHTRHELHAVYVFKWRRIPWLAERLPASQDGLCCSQSVNYETGSCIPKTLDRLVNWSSRINNVTVMCSFLALTDSLRTRLLVHFLKQLCGTKSATAQLITRIEFVRRKCSV